MLHIKCLQTKAGHFKHTDRLIQLMLRVCIWNGDKNKRYGYIKAYRSYLMKGNGFTTVQSYIFNTMKDN